MYVKNFASKVEVWSLSDEKKGSRVRLCFRVVDDVPEKKGMDLWKQMSSSKCSFTCICGIFLPLNPSTTTVYAWSAFYPSLRFTLSLQSAFYTQSAFYPLSAVCSPQSAVFLLHWPHQGEALKWFNLPWCHDNKFFPCTIFLFFSKIAFRKFWKQKQGMRINH